MTREGIIQKTVMVLQALPEAQAKEVADFADFMLKKYEGLLLQQGMQILQSESTSLSFLNEEEELCSTGDIKQKY
ncbi:MAG TPA: hypothetical protein VER36_01325 [Flavisolibacter sp.]|nr:hypothetical protein [Flavisolibacter sp.]